MQSSRSTVSADLIVAALDKRLVIPNATRWNSKYDAIVALIHIFDTKKAALHRVMAQLKITSFNEQDICLLKEYAKVLTCISMKLVTLPANLRIIH